jgi:hypothetical protein
MRNIANGGNYSVNLPAGTYRVVASTFGKTTQASDVVLFDGDVITDIHFDF